MRQISLAVVALLWVAACSGRVGGPGGGQELRTEGGVAVGEQRAGDAPTAIDGPGAADSRGQTEALGHLWSISFGGDNYDAVQQLLQGPDGALYIAGVFESTSIDFGGGPVESAGSRDFFVARFSADGAFEWVNTWGDLGYDSGHIGRVTSDGNLLIWHRHEPYDLSDCGEDCPHSYAHVAEVSPTGDIVWSIKLDLPESYASSCHALFAPDFFYVLGSYGAPIIIEGQELTSDGMADIFVARFDKDGNLDWLNSMGSDGYDSVVGGLEAGGVLDDDGNLFIAGSFNGQKLTVGDLVIDYEDTGEDPPPFFPPGQMFIAKLDPSGEPIWAFANKDSADLWLRADPLGGLYIAIQFGYFSSYSDSVVFSFAGEDYPAVDGQELLMARIDPDGNPAWTFAPGSQGAEWLRSFHIGKDGAIYLAGTTDSDKIDFGGGALAKLGHKSKYASDGFAAKIGPDGKHHWSKRFGTDGGTSAYLQLLDEQGLVLTGLFSPGHVGPEVPLNLGGGPVPADEGTYIARFDLDGKHIWSRIFNSNLYVQGAVSGGDDSLAIAGAFTDETIDLGGGPLVRTPRTEDCIWGHDAGIVADLCNQNCPTYCDDITNTDIFLARIQPPQR